MNISITRLILLVLGVVLLVVGVLAGIDAIHATDIIKGVFALVGIAVGFALLTGRGIHIGE